MIWGQPIAWFGLAAVAIPVLVHLLARRRAPRVAFPTLRFLPAAQIAAVRRHRLEDRALLAVRALIVAAAAAALAQPYVLAGDRAAPRARDISRIAIVDTSASMSRSAVGGQSAQDVAREAARAALAGATAPATIEAPRLRQALDAAILRLADAPGVREIVVVSDFQLGALDRFDLARVPADVGIRLMAVEMPPGIEPRTVSASVAPQIAVAAAPARQSQLEAVLKAVVASSTSSTAPSAEVVTVVFPGAPDAASLRASAQPIDRAWMIDVVARTGLGADVDARQTADGRLLLFAADDDVRAAASLIARVAAASPDFDALDELEPGTVPADTLRRWERPPTPRDAGQSTPRGRESDGRWLWAAALVLLAIEWQIRRRGTGPPSADTGTMAEERARVA
jgi:hypothetical protein